MGDTDRMTPERLAQIIEESRDDESVRSLWPWAAIDEAVAEIRAAWADRDALTLRIRDGIAQTEHMVGRYRDEVNRLVKARDVATSERDALRADLDAALSSRERVARALGVTVQDAPALCVRAEAVMGAWEEAKRDLAAARAALAERERERDAARRAFSVMWHPIWRLYGLCDEESRFGAAQREAAQILGHDVECVPDYRLPLAPVPAAPPAAEPAAAPPPAAAPITLASARLLALDSLMQAERRRAEDAPPPASEAAPSEVRGCGCLVTVGGYLGVCGRTLHGGPVWCQRCRALSAPAPQRDSCDRARCEVCGLAGSLVPCTVGRRAKVVRACEECRKQPSRVVEVPRFGAPATQRGEGEGR